VKEVASKFADHIDLELKEQSEDYKDSPRVSLKLSSRVSPLLFISPSRSPVQSLGIDVVQQEIYDYIKSLERKEAVAKRINSKPRKRN